MNLWGAIKELQEGKRIRQSHYAKGIYLYMDDDGYIRFNDGEKYRFMSGVNLDDDKWVIYEDEKEDEKDTREDVDDYIKELYKIICIMYDEYTSYNDILENCTKHDGINYILKLYNQLDDMNKYYKISD